MTKLKHTPEPWTVAHHYSGSTSIAIMRSPEKTISIGAPSDAPPRAYEAGEANAERIVECVNACAGLEDPAKAIEAAREALGLLCECAKNKGWKGSAWDNARAAYQLLTPQTLPELTK